MSHPRGGDKIQRLSHQKKKYCPKCVSGHLKSFKDTLVFRWKKGGAPTFEHFPLFLAKI